MRLSKKVWLIVGIVVLVVVLGFLFSMYNQTTAEHRLLSDRLALAQTRLPGLTSEKADLENQLVQAESQLASSAAKFPQSVESIEYGDDLFDIAAASRVQVTRLTASSPRDTTVGDVTYSVSSFAVVVSGEVSDILDFVHVLRTGRDFQLPWSAEVKGINIDYSTATASISFDIYGYKR